MNLENLVTPEMMDRQITSAVVQGVRADYAREMNLIRRATTLQEFIEVLVGYEESKVAFEIRSASELANIAQPAVLYSRPNQMGKQYRRYSKTGYLTYVSISTALDPSGQGHSTHSE